VDRINERFRSAKPGSSLLHEIGVMIHGIDGQEDDDYPWRVCPKSSMGCGFLSDRMSISVIYKGKTATFSGGGGVILSPDATRVLCAYGGDGGTRGKLCHPPGLTAQCVPGCMMGQGSYEAWCEPGPNDYWCDGHPWRPEELGTFLQRDRISQQYNEIIVDGFYWNEKLPRSIEAILTSPGDPQAAKTHAAGPAKVVRR